MKFLWKRFQSQAIASLLNRDKSWVNKTARQLGLPIHPRPTKWTPDRVAAFKALHAQGLSAEQMAKAMHLKVNMIRGKAFRLKLTWPKREKKPPKPRMPLRAAGRPRRALKVSLGIRVPRKPKTAPTPQPKPVESILAAIPTLEAPEPRNISLLDTGYRWCKYIKGQDDICCGHPVRWVGQPYCAYHHEICHERRK